MSSNSRTRHRQFGITLVEQLVGIAIAATAAGTAAPAWDNFIQRHRLDSDAAALRTEIHHARSLAISRNEGVRLQLQKNAGGACFLVHAGSAQDCQCDGQGRASCPAGTLLLRHGFLAAADGVELSSSSTNVLFDPLLGTTTPTATYEMRNRRGHVVRVIVNIMGRVRQCNVGVAASGLVAC